jgi:hypothetical protein
MSDYRSLVIVAGQTRQLVDTDRLIAGSGITSAAGYGLGIDAPSGQNVTIGASTAASVGIGSATAPVNVGGLLNANTMDRAAAGALSIGATTATSVGIGSSTAPVNVGGLLNANTMDRAAAGIITIGGTTATGVTIGKVGALTTIAGDLQVNGAETIVGLTTFTGDAQFNGNVVFGNAVTDTVSFFSVIGNGTYNDLVFNKAYDHVIKVGAQTTVDAAGKYLEIDGGKGGPASATGGGTGGGFYALAGYGGDGASGKPAGAGGDVEIGAGQSGALNGGTGNVGGHAYFYGGSSSLGFKGGNVRVWGGSFDTSGTNGDIDIARADKITIAADATSNDAVTITGDVTHVDDVYFGNTQDHNIKVVNTTTGSAAGKYLQIEAGNGGAASGAAGGVGGDGYLIGGVGGAGDATYAAGAGGPAGVYGGNAGAAAAGGGAIGGGAVLQAGNATGSAKGGLAFVRGGYSGTGDKGDITLEVAYDISLICDNAINLSATGYVQTGAQFRTSSQIRLGNTTTPSGVYANGFIYTKDVSGATELFWKDDTNPELQVTSNGGLNVGAVTSAPKVTFMGTSRATIAIGAPVCLNYDGANNGVFNADANGSGTGTQRCIGLADSAGGSGNPIGVVVSGEKATANAIWDAVPATTDVGKPAYLSENVGKLTLTAPSTSGSVVQVVGIVSVGGTGAVRVLVQPQTPVLL